MTETPMDTRYEEDFQVYLFLHKDKLPKLDQATKDLLRDVYYFAAHVWYNVGFGAGDEYRLGLMLKALDLDPVSIAVKKMKEEEEQDAQTNKEKSN